MAEDKRHHVETAQNQLINSSFDWSLWAKMVHQQFVVVESEL